MTAERQQGARRHPDRWAVRARPDTIQPSDIDDLPRRASARRLIDERRVWLPRYFAGAVKEVGVHGRAKTYAAHANIMPRCAIGWS